MRRAASPALRARGRAVSGTADLDLQAIRCSAANSADGDMLADVCEYAIAQKQRTETLQAEVARLAGELAAAISGWDDTLAESVDRRIRLDRALLWAWSYRKQRDALRAALARYGSHDWSCGYWTAASSESLEPVCICGLSQALRDADGVQE